MIRKHTHLDKSGLERDENNKRTGFKIMIWVREPMSQEGYDRWSHAQKRYVSKSKYIWKPYASSYAVKEPNGVPMELMKDTHEMMKHIIDIYYLCDGKTYRVHGWGHRKTRTHVGYTKRLFTIKLYRAEGYKYQFIPSKHFNNYWFRRESLKNRKNMWV